MKIAVNTRLLLRDKLSGIGWFTYHTLKNLVHLHPEHKFIFLFDRPFDDQFIFGNNVKPVVVYPQARHPFLYYIWFNYSIVPVINKHKADIFLSPDGFLSMNLRKIPSIPVIHDLNFEHFPNDLPYLTQRYYRHYFPKYAKIAKRIITVSEYSKYDISKLYDIDLNKIDVAYNGASDDFIPVDPITQIEIRKKYAHGNDYFLYVGNLLPRKNIARLIQAYSLFRKNGESNTRLLIVGEKMFLTSDIEEAYRNSEYKDDILFTGRLPQYELVKVVGSAKALVFVSIFEGFGLPIVEAMKAGVPVITSSTSSMPEIAGNAAILVDPLSIESIKQAMLLIDKDETLRNELIFKGKLQSARFTWANTAHAVWNSIEKALGNQEV